MDIHKVLDPIHKFKPKVGILSSTRYQMHLREKVTEHHRERNIVFVDQEKAFDRENRDKL